MNIASPMASWFGDSLDWNHDPSLQRRKTKTWPRTLCNAGECRYNSGALEAEHIGWNKSKGQVAMQPLHHLGVSRVSLLADEGDAGWRGRLARGRFRVKDRYTLLVQQKIGPQNKFWVPQKPPSLMSIHAPSWRFAPRVWRLTPSRGFSSFSGGDGERFSKEFWEKVSHLVVPHGNIASLSKCQGMLQATLLPTGTVQSQIDCLSPTRSADVDRHENSSLVRSNPWLVSGRTVSASHVDAPGCSAQRIDRTVVERAGRPFFCAAAVLFIIAVQDCLFSLSACCWASSACGKACGWHLVRSVKSDQPTAWWH